MLYTGSNLSMTFSNATGLCSMWSSNERLGLNQPAPKFTLDVNGDINFSGKIYQQGAIFSGWNSNASGNYINSNAAFRGQATATDVLLLYTTPGNEAFSFCNATGKASLYSSNASVGVGASAPTSVLDVNGDLRARAGVFAHSNASATASAVFASMRSNTSVVGSVVAAGFAGDVIATGSAWTESLFATNAGMMSRLSLTGSSGAVTSNAALYNGAGSNVQALANPFAAPTWPVRAMNPILSMPTGDALTSNIYSYGTAMIQNSAYVNGALQANQTRVQNLTITSATNTFVSSTLALNAAYVAPTNLLPISTNLVLDCSAGDAMFANAWCTGGAFVNGAVAVNGPLTANAASMRSVRLTGCASNFYPSMVSANTTNALPTGNPLASANASLLNTLLTVEGDAALDASLGVRSNAYIGGTVFVGSNVNSSTPLLPNGIVPSLSNVVLDCQGDVVLENNAYVRTQLLVGQQIGVGTQAPSYPVDVQANTNGVSLNCAAKVTAAEFSVYSDRRIKTDIQAVDVDAYLAALGRLTVRTFSYVDPADKGAGAKTGFIAQEVEAVLPACVVSCAEYLPNVMAELAIASYDGRFGAQVTVPAPYASLFVPGASLKARHSGTTILCSVVGSADPSADGSIVVALTLGCTIPSDAASLFAVGTQVHDFKMLNYEQINTIAIGAIQAQQRRIVALEAAILKLGL